MLLLLLGGKPVPRGRSRSVPPSSLPPLVSMLSLLSRCLPIPFPPNGYRNPFGGVRARRLMSSSTKADPRSRPCDIDPSPCTFLRSEESLTAECSLDTRLNAIENREEDDVGSRPIPYPILVSSRGDLGSGIEANEDWLRRICVGGSKVCRHCSTSEFAVPEGTSSTTSSRPQA